MCLIGLIAGRGRRVFFVLPGGEPAAWAVPLFRYLVLRLLGKAGPRYVPICAPVGDIEARSSFAPFCFAHWTRADARTTDCVRTNSHDLRQSSQPLKRWRSPSNTMTPAQTKAMPRSEEHTSELQSRGQL